VEEPVEAAQEPLPAHDVQLPARREDDLVGRVVLEGDVVGAPAAGLAAVPDLEGVGGDAVGLAPGEADGVELYDLEPAGIPDMLAQRPVMVLGKYRNAEDPATLTLKGIGGDGDREWRFNLAEAQSTDASLPQLWARKRLQRLYVIPESDEARQREAIVELGLGYSLLTRHTSFIAVDETPLEDRWGGWYVTGTHGDQRHMGNAVVAAGEERVDREAGANVVELDGFLDVSRYASPHSDRLGPARPPRARALRVLLLLLLFFFVPVVLPSCPARGFCRRRRFGAWDDARTCLPILGSRLP